MEGYKATVVKSSKELTAREKIQLKDTTNAVSLDEVTQGSEGGFIIPVAFTVELAIHNEYSEDKDYPKYVIVDTAGTKYVTGSKSFWSALSDIMDEMADAGEDDITIEVYRRESKNYKGKQFITCSLV